MGQVRADEQHADPDPKISHALQHNAHLRSRRRESGRWNLFRGRGTGDHPRDLRIMRDRTVGSTGHEDGSADADRRRAKRSPRNGTLQIWPGMTWFENAQALQGGTQFSLTDVSSESLSLEHPALSPLSDSVRVALGVIRRHPCHLRHLINLHGSSLSRILGHAFIRQLADK